MQWQQFVMRLESLNNDDVEAILLHHGAAAVTLSDAADNPILEPGRGETPLWSDTEITALFDADADLDVIKASLLRELELDELPTYRIDRLADRVWEREWLKDFAPMRFGERLWIYPSNHTPTDDANVIVRLDPGLAFGTGTHATTALCLEWLDGLDLTGKTILDYGCGSGVLAIAALKLGCTDATAMDIDPQAVLATRQNASDNGVLQNLTILDHPAEIQGAFDIVVANILAGPLVEFADSITDTLCRDGMLALSGVLCEQADDVMAAYKPGIAFDAPVFRPQDGQTWSRLTGQRRTT